MVKQLSIVERFDKLNDHADKAFSESMDLLSKHGRALIVRPTGFGKTRLAVRLAKMYANMNEKRVLYLYPLDIIKTTILSDSKYMADGIIEDRVDFVAYNTFTVRFRTDESQERFIGRIKEAYSLIILDEAHRAGSNGFREFHDIADEIIGSDGLHMVGMTATPDRPDSTEDENVLNSIFKGVKISDFTIIDAMNEGIMMTLIYGLIKYDMEDIVKRFKKKGKGACEKKGKEFDEKSFNVEIGRAFREIGGASRKIYKYIKMAGYNFVNNDKHSYKIIVFFSSIQAMAEKGPTVEDWYRNAFNVEAKEDQKFRGLFDFRAYYVASADTPDGDIAKLMEFSNGKRRFIRKADKVSEIKESKRTIDLIFTVNMINMGYHIENVMGVGMLRGTKSGIVFTQQMGRCMSVMSMHRPIVWDFANNAEENFWIKKKDKRKRAEAAVAKICGGEREDLDSDLLDLIIVDDFDAVDKVLSRWSNTSYSDYSGIVWMYENRKMPVCGIAADTGKSCKEILDILIKMHVKLRHEDAMFDYCDKNERYSSLRTYLVSNKVKKLVHRGKTLLDILKQRL